jgi:hypothetical protein
MEKMTTLFGVGECGVEMREKVEWQRSISAKIPHNYKNVKITL